MDEPGRKTKKKQCLILVTIFMVLIGCNFIINHAEEKLKTLPVSTNFAVPDRTLQDSNINKAPYRNEEGLPVDFIIIDDEEVEEQCSELGFCEFCSNDEDACATTGRRIRFECVAPSGERRHFYQSCLRTNMEEEWLVLKVQMICAFLGMLSLRSTRLRKQASASLFDQRRNGSSKAKRKLSMEPLQNRDKDEVSVATIESERSESESLIRKDKDDVV